MSSKVDPEDKEALKASANIEKQIRTDKKTFDRTVKILLLGTPYVRRLSSCGNVNMLAGAGESGKSTIIKQMRIIHSGGFPQDEREQNRAVIYSNLIVAFKVLMDIMNNQKIDFEKEDNKVRLSRLREEPQRHPSR
jgi:guanine nucleotide-binding protein subunit alpha